MTSEINALISAWLVDGITVRAMYGTVIDFKQYQVDIATNGSCYAIGQIREDFGQALVKNTCGDVLQAYTARLYVASPTQQTSFDKLRAWLGLIYKTTGGRVGKPSAFPIDYNGVTLFRFGPFADQLDVFTSRHQNFEVADVQIEMVIQTP